MKRVDMLAKTAADAARRRAQLEARAAWYAARHAEAAAEQEDRAVIAHMGAREAFDVLTQRRQARGVPADRGTVLGKLPLAKTKLFKLGEAR